MQNNTWLKIGLILSNFVELYMETYTRIHDICHSGLIRLRL